MREEFFDDACVELSKMCKFFPVGVADDEVTGGESVLVGWCCVFREEIGGVGRDDHIGGEVKVGVIMVNVG